MKLQKLPFVEYNFLFGGTLFNIYEFIFILFIFIIILTFRVLIGKILIKIISKLTFISNFLQDKKNLQSSLSLIPFIIYISFFTSYYHEISFSNILNNINKSLFIIFIFWFVYSILNPILKNSDKLENLTTKVLYLWVLKSFKFILIIISTITILEIWGFKIGPIIAGLGLFGVAVALGAQDLFKNLISGVMIIAERRFVLNDVIEIPAKTIGTVTDIGFRSTLIKQFDSTIISIPNYLFSESPIINYSKRDHRRIKWVIGLNYDTSIEKLKNVCNQIQNYIEQNKDFCSSNDYFSQVRIEKFNESSIDILINCFTITKDWTEYLEVKEKLAIKIKKIVEENNTSFAFPSRSIYIEK